MRVMNIASGSSGNVTYVGAGNTHILVDVGISKKRITDALNEKDIALGDIGGILLTHEHIDHISGLGVLERAAGIPIYATAGTIRGIKECRSLGNFDQELFREIKPGEKFEIGDVSICPIKTSHDAYESVAFRLDAEGSSFAVLTDLGMYDENIVEALQGLNGILLEANHDVRMLEVGPYPYQLKRRILGDRGHLSNETSGQLLSRLLNDNIKYITLGHLSKENNTRDLAYMAVKMEIEMAANAYKGDDFDINVAWRDRPSEMAEF